VSKFRTAAIFVILDLQTTVYAQLLDTFMTCIYIKFYILSFDDLLIIAIRPKAKKCFASPPLFFFYKTTALESALALNRLLCEIPGTNEKLIGKTRKIIICNLQPCVSNLLFVCVWWSPWLCRILRAATAF
jgi:hypothetical protein